MKNWNIIAEKSMENAKKYYEDAILLLNNHSYGHAMSFAILGIEEFSKSLICKFSIYADEKKIKIDRLEKVIENEVFKNHNSKIYVSLFYDRIWLPLIEKKEIKETNLKDFIDSFKFDLRSIKEKPEEINRDKQKGFYVNLDSSSPLDIKKNSADRYIILLKSLIQKLEDRDTK